MRPGRAEAARRALLGDVAQAHGAVQRVELDAHQGRIGGPPGRCGQVRVRPLEQGLRRRIDAAERIAAKDVLDHGGGLGGAHAALALPNIQGES